MPDYGPIEQYLTERHPAGFTYHGTCTACRREVDDDGNITHRRGCPVGKYHSERFGTRAK